MEPTVGRSDFEGGAGLARKRSFVNGGFEAFFHGGDVFLGNVATDHLRFKHETGTWLKRFDFVSDFRELTGTAGLFLVGVFVFDGLGDGFAVGDLRTADDNFHFVRALQDVDFDFEEKLPHAFENPLVGFRIGPCLYYHYYACI